jgi:hypothetical protein
MSSPIEENPTIKLLTDAGFSTGWVVRGDTLILWEHDEEPPTPLTRPEATDETPSPD